MSLLGLGLYSDVLIFKVVRRKCQTDTLAMYIKAGYTIQYNVHRRLSGRLMASGKYVLYHTKQKKNNSVYVYYLLAWYYRKNNKPYRDTLKHLGKLSEREVDRYKMGLAYLNRDPNIQLCNIDDIEILDSREYLPCAVGDYLWNSWELSEILGSGSARKDVATADIAKILTIIRWAQTCSKSYSVELYSETCLAELTGVPSSSYNTARIFRELENIETKREELGKHIFKIAKRKGYTKGEVLFYDLSSGNIAGLRCVMAKWGHSKDGYRTHVVLMLVITPEGYPVYWELLEGNTSEVKTIEPLIAKIESTFGKIESVLCFDRGMVSDENLNLLENRTHPLHFITALDGDQIHHFKSFINLDLLNEVKQLPLKEESLQIKTKLTAEGFQFVQNNLFFKELCLSESQKEEIENTTEKLGLKARRYFLAFNPELAYLTHKHRKERVQEFIDWINNYNEELAIALADKKETIVINTIKSEMKKNRIANVDIPYELILYQVENKNKKGIIKKATTYKVILPDNILDTAYQRAREYDGIWVLITNIPKENDQDFFNKTNFSSYFDIYRLKNNIEESFKILSQFVGVEPFYVYKTNHVKAHFTICVLSYLLDIIIVNRIRTSRSISNLSLQRIFHILKKCKQNIIKISKDHTVSKLTQVTKQQKELLEVLDCKHLISEKFLAKKNIITINKT